MGARTPDCNREMSVRFRPVPTMIRIKITLEYDHAKERAICEDFANEVRQHYTTNDVEVTAIVTEATEAKPSDMAH